MPLEKGRLEPEAENVIAAANQFAASEIDYGTTMAAAAISAAVSLKRIADALNSPNEYGEVGSVAIAGAIVRGLRG